MSRTRKILCLCGVVAFAIGCEKSNKGAEAEAPKPAAAQAAVVEAPPKPKIDPAVLAIFQNPPRTPANDPAPLVELGKLLYFENRLSKNHDLSCNSCHDLAAYGVDGKQFSSGHKGQLGGRNSPTVYDAAHHVAQFWDGRAKDLAEQAEGPVLNPVEMAMPDAKLVAKTLASIPEYQKRFKEVFPTDKAPITLTNAAKAMAAFERTLVTESRFDAYLAGDKTALNDAELRGLETFISSGCTACHMGPNLGGTMFQKLGLVKPWPAPENGELDTGRFQATQNETDKYFFRVAALRNVEKTAPYFHDGAVASLDEAISQMARHQLGRELTEAQVKDIAAFLRSHTGTLPDASVIAAPTLPPSSARTPKPDPT